MLRSNIVWVVIAGTFACGGDPATSLEETCAPLKAGWEEVIRADVEARFEKEWAARLKRESSLSADGKGRSERAVGPAISAGERALIKRAAGGREAESTAPDVVEVEAIAGPEALSKRDKVALADDPAAGQSTAAARIDADGTVVVPARTPRPGVTLLGGDTKLSLSDLVVGTSVEAREPVGASHRFRAGVERFYCYAVYQSATADQASVHVWRFNGKVISRVELMVGKSPSWRTWSRHSARSGATGKWSCEVLGPAGKRLGIARFQVSR